MITGSAAAAEAAEAAARQSYGRLLARLAWQWRDIAAAEDALAEAFALALRSWPVHGVPASPEGWLMTVSKRQLLTAARRQQLADDPTLTVLWPSENEAVPDDSVMTDSRLKLMFVCTHPAIDAGVRSALMLQTVLGLEAARIASAFLVSPEAMTKRLVRAKAKIKATGIRFEEPHLDEWPERMSSVLEAVYGAYTLHWDLPQEGATHELAEEATYLAELVAAHLPTEPEALGLLALLWLCESRRPARLGTDGVFIPLTSQDTDRWRLPLIERADASLTRAARLHQPGPYQFEAAIQAAHTQGLLARHVPWPEIARLYEHLLGLSPTVGARIGHAVATAHASDDAQLGLNLLDALDTKHVGSHQPWWAARAELLAWSGRSDEAQQAYGRALALTAEPALRRWFERKLGSLGKPAGA